MTVWRRPRAERRDAITDFLGGLRRARMTGTSVSADSAMRVSTVWACATLLAELVASLPVDVVEARPDGTRRPVVPQPRLVHEPSGMVDGLSWRRQLVLSWLLSGNAWGMAGVDDQGRLVQVELLDPRTVHVRRDPSTGDLAVTVGGTDMRLWPAGPLLHWPGMTLPGSRVGVSVLEHAARTVGLHLSAEDWGRSWFDSGAHPTAILKTDARVDEEQARMIKRRFVDAVRDREGPAVLGLGLSYEPVSVSASDAQFLDTLQATTEQIVRFFFPSSVLDHGSSITYQNVELRALHFITFDANPWIVRVERALSSLLDTDREFVRLNRTALLRTDASTRWANYRRAVVSGILTRNEVRALEDLPPIDGGDELPPLSSSSTV